ncbi:hypothetical protein ADK91_21315 [Streptomyces sp. XY511]|nr:hypothetical protein [Streptomyces sp. XY511]KOV02020.1 hypothetical protein ADK91_21315 [Streptomyces sp. XY511]
MPLTELPPGVELVTLPGGIRTLAYTHHATAPAAPAPAAQPVPVWAKTTALLAPTIGGGVAAAGLGLSYASPGLDAMTHTLWAGAAIVAALAATPALLRAGRTRTSGQQRGPVQHITQNITANGMFGRANGTINQQ